MGSSEASESRKRDRLRDGASFSPPRLRSRAASAARPCQRGPAEKTRTWAALQTPSEPQEPGAVTALIALIPFGAPVVWGSLSIWLLLTGNIGNGVGLLIWGVGLVSWMDNIVRPLVISNATRMPFLLVVFGSARLEATGYWNKQCQWAGSIEVY